MGETELVKGLINHGIGGVIAAFMFLLYRRDIRDAKAKNAELAEKFDAAARDQREVIVNNTRAMAQLESTNAQLSRAIEAANITVRRGHHGEV